MRSVNHQFPEYSDRVIARYVKSVMIPISGYRLNPRNGINPNERIEFLLTTDEEDIEITPYDEGENTKHRQVKFSYDNEVLELYTDIEVRSFERMNRLLIENGILIPYSETAPDIDKSNVITAREIKALLKQSQLDLVKSLSKLTSMQLLEKIESEFENADTTTMAQLKTIRARIKELKNESNN